MLTLLRINSLAIVKNVEVEFTDGLNVLTGETGAGKSVILRALALLSGIRATSDLVQRGAERAEIEAQFMFPEARVRALAASSDALHEYLGDAVVEGGVGGRVDGRGDSMESPRVSLVVRRTIDSKGNSRVFLNGRMITVNTLQEIMDGAIEITGQFQNQQLLQAGKQRSLLDGFGVAGALLADVRDKYRLYQRAKDALDNFLVVKESLDQDYEIKKSQVEELTNAALDPGELESLEAAEHEQKHLEKVTELASRMLMFLEQGDESILEKFRRLSVTLAETERYTALFADLHGVCQQAWEQADEVRAGIERVMGRLELEPERLETMRERISLLKMLQRKYRRSIEDLVVWREELNQEIADIESGKFSEDELRKAFQEAENSYRKVEHHLTGIRCKIAGELGERITKELHTLGLAKARFEARITPSQPSEFGGDKVEFYWSANPGTELLPLAKTASGGELSRVLLALKVVLGSANQGSLQVFDEVDAGVGGAIAQVVGERLVRLAQTSQVIVVTHSPQVASMGDEHFIVRKTIQSVGSEEQYIGAAADEVAVVSSKVKSGRKQLADGKSSGKKQSAEILVLKNEVKDGEAGREVGVSGVLASGASGAVMTSSEIALVEVVRLTPVDRIGEVARMLGGRNVSEKFFDSAKELIAYGRDYRMSCGRISSGA